MTIKRLSKFWHRAGPEIQATQGSAAPSADQQISAWTSDWNRAALLRARQTEYPLASEPVKLTIHERSPRLRIHKPNQEETYATNALALSRLETKQSK